MASGTRNRAPTSSDRAYPRHTVRSAVSLRHLHTTRTHSTIDLVSRRASFSLPAVSLSHDVPTIVSLVPAQQQWPDLQSPPSICSSACGARSKGSRRYAPAALCAPRLHARLPFHPVTRFRCTFWDPDSAYPRINSS